MESGRKKEKAPADMAVRVDAEEMRWLLWRAFDRGDAKRVEELLAAGGDANGSTPKDVQPFGYKRLSLLGVACARRSEVSMIKALLKGGADPNAAQSESGGGALHVLLSCESDADLDEPDFSDTKRGPALARRARALIKGGANPNLQSAKGVTPLIVALEDLNAPVREPMVAELLSLGARFKESGAEELFRCVDGASPNCSHPIEDTMAVFERLLAAGASVDESGPWSAQRLRERAKEDRPATLEFIERHLEARELRQAVAGATGQAPARRGRRPGI